MLADRNCNKPQSAALSGSIAGTFLEKNLQIRFTQRDVIDDVEVNRSDGPLGRDRPRLEPIDLAELVQPLSIG